MKLIIAGGRDFADYLLLKQKFDELACRTTNSRIEIVSGMARGADHLGWKLARERFLACHEFRAAWLTLGKRAGFERNKRMADAADELLAFWDGKSKGTQHMINTMKKLGKPVHVVRY